MTNRTCSVKNPCREHTLEALKARKVELEEKLEQERATAQALVDSTAVAAAIEKAHVATNRASAGVPRAYSLGFSDGKQAAVAAYAAQSWWSRLLNRKPEGF